MELDVKQADRLFIVMPAYNEEENIEKTIRKWYPLLEGKEEGSRLVIADSGSTDKTHEILLSLQKELPKLEILPTKRKEHGPKVIALYQYGCKQEADYIFQTDSDDQTNPDEFEAFWNKREQYDVILGNRIQRGDGKDRAMVEKVVCHLCHLYFGVSLPDANAPFRLMKKDVLEKYLPLLEEDYALPNIILSSYFKREKEKLAFLPISFEPRKKGKNSINLKRIFKIGLDSLLDFSRYRKKIKAFEKEQEDQKQQGKKEGKEDRW